MPKTIKKDHLFPKEMEYRNTAGNSSKRRMLLRDVK